VLSGLSVVLVTFSFAIVFVTNPDGLELGTWIGLIGLAYSYWTPSVKETKTAKKAAKLAEDLAMEEAERVAAGESPSPGCCCGLVSGRPRPRFYTAAILSALIFAGVIARVSELAGRGDINSKETAAWIAILVQVYGAWGPTAKDGKKKDHASPGAHDRDLEPGLAAEQMEVAA